MAQRVLLIGSGGREHAIAHQLIRSPRCDALYIAPGNPGTMQCGTNVPIAADDIDGLLAFAQQNSVDITIVGPEQPLALGIVDAFAANGRAIIGPNKQAAQLESSKAWAKARYTAYGIPTAPYESFTQLDAALAYLNAKNTYPIVIKADGLAAGKGVTIARSFMEAKQALDDCFVHQVFQSSGECVVIEDFLIGEEASLFAFTDGKTVVPMVSAQDHKAIYNGDTGPNTGGMGAYSPAPVLTDAVQQRVMDTILQPLVDGFRSDGICYKGILYAGLMIDDAGIPSVVEFNIRFGDPETQIVLPKLKTDILDVFNAIHDERLHDLDIQWASTATVCVVMAADGYPGSVTKGDLIHGLDDGSDASTWVIQAGTILNEQGAYLTHGGRVLNVCAESSSLKSAIDAAYKRVSRISFDGAYYRTDIGQKGLARLTPPT